MVEPIELEVSSVESRRGSALVFISHVCYPHDEGKRSRFILTVGSTLVKNSRDEHGIYETDPRIIFLRKEVSQRTCRRSLHRATKILMAKRIPIARDIAGSVGAIRAGYPGKGPRSITVAIDDYAQANDRDPVNVRQREWYPTRPVAHLALGFLMAVDWDRCQDMSLMELIFGPEQPDWIDKAIELSNHILDRLLCANVISDDHSPIVICAKKRL